MPFRPEPSLLRVEVPALHTIDTSSVENLFGMWSLFSKASHAIEDGKRLENLSWRLWNRETFCCSSQTQARSRSLSPPCSFPARPSASATDIPMPALSSSLDSASSEELDESRTTSLRAAAIPQARPELRRDDSTCSTSRGREKHITPVDLEKIVLSIKETSQLQPSELPLPSPLSRPADQASPAVSQNLPKPRLDSRATEASQQPEDTASNPSSSQVTVMESSASTVGTNGSSPSDQSQTVGSEQSSTTAASTHSIVRGFVPGGAPSSYRSQTNLAAKPTPILKAVPAPDNGFSKKKPTMFQLGSDSGEDESSLESRMLKSSLSEGLKRPGSHSSQGSKKQTSFKDELTIGKGADGALVETDDEEEQVSESAIEDDDDSSDWEDSDEQSRPSSVNEKDLFQRVDSRPNLTSRRSLLTTLIHEPDRVKDLANAASRSTPAIRRSRTSTPNGPSLATSPESGIQTILSGQGIPGSKPIIMTTSNTHQAQLALSPRTTRRNMLSTELTESLRKNLLWERQHRSTGNFAALKRRHTAQEMTKLKQHPEPGPVLSRQAGKNFTNDYFHAGLGEYHAKGW